MVLSDGSGACELDLSGNDTRPILYRPCVHARDIEHPLHEYVVDCTSTICNPFVYLGPQTDTTCIVVRLMRLCQMHSGHTLLSCTAQSCTHMNS